MIENLNVFFTKQNIEQLFELTGTWLLHENWGVKKPKNEEIGLSFTLYLHTFEKFKVIGIPFGNTAVTDKKAKGNNQLINQKGKCEVICHLEKPFPTQHIFHSWKLGHGEMPYVHTVNSSKLTKGLTLNTILGGSIIRRICSNEFSSF